MTTTADFTTRVRDEIFSIYTQYQSTQRRVQDLADEVIALGGAAGIYGTNGINFPTQGDDFDYSDMTAAFTNLASLIGAPTTAQKQTIIRARRT